MTSLGPHMPLKPIAKDQVAQVADFNPGGVNVRKPVLAQAHDGLLQARKPFNTGQQGRTVDRKHRSSRRSRTFV